MAAVRYDTIAPNIALVEVNGATVQVTWKCPVSGREIGRSTATMAADSTMTSRVQASVARSLASEVIYGAARFVAGLVGGTAGRVVSNAAYTAAGDLNTRVTAGVDYTEASRQAAIVAAFDAVKTSFVWDDRQGRFVAQST
jgi:hypothetical protein